MSTPGFSFAAIVVTALLALWGDRFQARRTAVAEALVSALTEAQRPTFLLDLANPDHSELVTRPVEEWVTLLGALEPGVVVTDEQRRDKVDEILGWRMAERRDRVRFAAVARAREIRHLARYYDALSRAAVVRNEKVVGPVSPEVNAISEQLVHTVAAVRVPSVLWPLHTLVRRLPGIRGLLVSDDDLRILVADYAPTPNPPG
jgi:hypothetical protein